MISELLSGSRFCAYCGKEWRRYGSDPKKLVDAEQKRDKLRFRYFIITYVISALLYGGVLFYLMPNGGTQDAVRTWVDIVMFSLIGYFGFLILMLPLHIRVVFRAKLKRFGNMRRANVFGGREIGNGAGNFDDAEIRPRRQGVFVIGMLQKFF